MCPQKPEILEHKIKLQPSDSTWYTLDIVKSNPARNQLASMGKMKKAGINEKAVDARAAKEMAKTSKQEKESKQKEDADWAAAGEGASKTCTVHSLLVTALLAGEQHSTAASEAHTC